MIGFVYLHFGLGPPAALHPERFLVMHLFVQDLVELLLEAYAIVEFTPLRQDGIHLFLWRNFITAVKLGQELLSMRELLWVHVVNMRYRFLYILRVAEKLQFGVFSLFIESEAGDIFCEVLAVHSLDVLCLCTETRIGRIRVFIFNDKATNIVVKLVLIFLQLVDVINLL